MVQDHNYVHITLIVKKNSNYTKQGDNNEISYNTIPIVKVKHCPL
jgi:hypothetical protein